MNYKYKFEKFKDLNFPVYSSVQSGEGTIVIPHHHKAAEINLVLNGNCDFFIDSTIISCKEYDIVFIPPYSVHTVIGKGPETKIKGITFEFSLFDELFKDYSIESKLNKNNINLIGNYFVEDISKNISKIIADFSVFDKDNSPSCRLRIIGNLLVIISELLEQFDNTVYDDNNTRLTPVFDYIKNNYNSPIRISDMSSLLNICDDHFIKLFKSATNKTPIKYINDLRIEAALKLLVDSNLSITQIADRVGFSNINYMIKVFKDTLNTTPKAYKTKKP